MSKNNIVLFEPEIPQNTGNIMRTCAGTDTYLHLIKPLGFKIDDASLKRAAVNYLPNVHFKVYENWEEFISQNNGKMYFFTRYGLHTPHELKLDNPNESIILLLVRNQQVFQKKS